MSLRRVTAPSSPAETTIALRRNAEIGRTARKGRRYGPLVGSFAFRGIDLTLLPVPRETRSTRHNSRCLASFSWPDSWPAAPCRSQRGRRPHPPRSPFPRDDRSLRFPAPRELHGRPIVLPRRRDNSGQQCSRCSLRTARSADAVTFGLGYDPGTSRSAPPNGAETFELADGDWPNRERDGRGLGCRANLTRSSGCTVSSHTSMAGFRQLSLIAHQRKEAYFGDDSVPARNRCDRRTQALGFGQSGELPCPPAWPEGAAASPMATAGFEANPSVPPPAGRTQATAPTAPQPLSTTGGMLLRRRTL